MKTIFLIGALFLGCSPSNTYPVYHVDIRNLPECSKKVVNSNVKYVTFTADDGYTTLFVATHGHFMCLRRK